MMLKRAPIFIFAFLLLFLVRQGEASIVVQLMPEAVVTGKSFSLGEIAVVHGVRPNRESQWTGLEVGVSPRAGETAVVTQSRVARVLRLSGLALENLELSGAAETVVARESQTVSADMLHQLVREHVMARMPWDAENVSIEQIRGARDLVLAATAVTHQVKAQPNCDYLGLTSFQVVTATGDGEEIQQWVKADIQVTTPVVVARHPIPRLTQLGTADVKVEKRNLASLSSDTVASVDEVVGKRSRREIRAGEPIRLSQVELAPVVRRGDLVTLKVESEHFLVTARGKVLENGRPGEVIRVENIASRKQVYGKVVDGRTLLVGF